MIWPGQDSSGRVRLLSTNRIAAQPTHERALLGGYILGTEVAHGALELAFVARAQPFFVGLGQRLHRDRVVERALVEPFVASEEALDEVCDRRLIASVAGRTPVDRCAVEPGIDGGLQRRPVRLAAFDAEQGGRRRAVVAAQRLHVARFVAERNTILVGQAHEDLDLAQLRGLEATRRIELVAERQVVLRPHRLHELEVLRREIEADRDAAQALHGTGERVFGHRLLREEVARGGEFAQHELEPEFIDLVDDDEAHLIVTDLVLVRGDAALQAEQLLDADVVPVARGAGRGAGHPRKLTASSD